MERYNIREAAKRCDVKIRTIRQWIRSGKIHAEKQENGWFWQIPDSEIRRVNYQRMGTERFLDDADKD